MYIYTYIFYMCIHTYKKFKGHTTLTLFLFFTWFLDLLQKFSVFVLPSITGLRFELVSSNWTLLMDGLRDAYSSHKILVGKQSQRNIVLISHMSRNSSWIQEMFKLKKSKEIGHSKARAHKIIHGIICCSTYQLHRTSDKNLVSHLSCSKHTWLSQMCSVQLRSKWTKPCQHRRIKKSPTRKSSGIF